MFDLAIGIGVYMNKPLLYRIQLKIIILCQYLPGYVIQSRKVT